jgi:prolyl-tRNA synthetase
MAYRAMDKLNCIIHEELTRIHAYPLTLPLVAPAALWNTTGRLDTMGPQVLLISTLTV